MHSTKIKLLRALSLPHQGTSPPTSRIQIGVSNKAFSLPSKVVQSKSIESQCHPIYNQQIVVQGQQSFLNVTVLVGKQRVIGSIWMALPRSNRSCLIQMVAQNNFSKLYFTLQTEYNQQSPQSEEETLTISVQCKNIFPIPYASDFLLAISFGRFQEVPVLRISGFKQLVNLQQVKTNFFSSGLVRLPQMKESSSMRGKVRSEWLVSQVRVCMCTYFHREGKNLNFIVVGSSYPIQRQIRESIYFRNSFQVQLKMNQNTPFASSVVRLALTSWQHSQSPLSLKQMPLAGTTSQWRLLSESLSQKMQINHRIIFQTNQTQAEIQSIGTSLQSLRLSAFKADNQSTISDRRLLNLKQSQRLSKQPLPQGIVRLESDQVQMKILQAGLTLKAMQTQNDKIMSFINSQFDIQQTQVLAYRQQFSTNQKLIRELQAKSQARVRLQSLVKSQSHILHKLEAAYQKKILKDDLQNQIRSKQLQVRKEMSSFSIVSKQMIQLKLQRQSLQNILRHRRKQGQDDIEAKIMAYQQQLRELTKFKIRNH